MEKETAIHSSILVWRIPWTEEPDRLQSIGSHRVRHDLSDLVKDMRIKSTSYRDPPPPSVVRKSKSVAPWSIPPPGQTVSFRGQVSMLLAARGLPRR